MADKRVPGGQSFSEGGPPTAADCVCGKLWCVNRGLEWDHTVRRSEVVDEEKEERRITRVSADRRVRLVRRRKQII